MKAFSVIQGGKKDPEELPITVNLEANKDDTIYIAITPRGLLGAFTNEDLANECCLDYPDVNILEVPKNCRLDKLSE